MRRRNSAYSGSPGKSKAKSEKPAEDKQLAPAEDKHLKGLKINKRK